MGGEPADPHLEQRHAWQSREAGQIDLATDTGEPQATEQRLLAEAEERSEKARAAEESYRTEEANLELSKRIFDRTSIKFTNGLASSFELNQDQSQYLQAQSAYIQRLVDLLLARADLRRSLDLY